MHLHDIISVLQDHVRELDTATLRSADALRLVESFTEIERIAIAGRTLAAARVQQTGAWRATGRPSVVAWMAERTGRSFSHAAATLNTAMRLEQQPAIREALVTGKLSQSQVNEISAAADADPSAEAALVQLAAHESVAALRERCRDVRAAAGGDEDARERVRRSRYFRNWLDNDGAVRLDARLAADDAAPLLAAVRARTEALVADAAGSDARDLREAYAADALCALADGEGAPKAIVHVVVSKDALERGHTVAGETCSIDGVGPTTVAGARRLAATGTMTMIERTANDVHSVTNAGRTIPAAVRAALEARDPTCVVPGCNRRQGLEIDHIVPFAEGGPTKLENLARICGWHHSQKTYHGWRLEGVPGAWTWRRVRGVPGERA